jgi:hypothetical protein
VQDPEFELGFEPQKKKKKGKMNGIDIIKSSDPVGWWFVKPVIRATQKAEIRRILI